MFRPRLLCGGGNPLGLGPRHDHLGLGPSAATFEQPRTAAPDTDRHRSLHAASISASSALARTPSVCHANNISFTSMIDLSAWPPLRGGNLSRPQRPPIPSFLRPLTSVQLTQSSCYTKASDLSSAQLTQSSCYTKASDLPSVQLTQSTLPQQSARPLIGLRSQKRSVDRLGFSAHGCFYACLQIKPSSKKLPSLRLSL